MPPCEFSDAEKVIAGFRNDASRYGEVVYAELEKATGISQKRFERMASGPESDWDELAHQIISYRTPTRSECVQLYPDKFSDGMAMLTNHARTQGFAGVVYLIDELTLYLTGKSGRDNLDQLNDLVALADNSALDRAVPLWVTVAKQRNISDTVLEDQSQHQIHEVLDFHKDRFPETTKLADTELVPSVQERVLRTREGMGAVLNAAVEKTLSELSDEASSTLLHDLSLDDFLWVYPFHPALIRTLIDVTAAHLSRERPAIRFLFELLIERHPNLAFGSLVPYTSLFEVVFMLTGLIGGAQNVELDAVRQTYFEQRQGKLSSTYTVPEWNMSDNQE